MSHDHREHEEHNHQEHDHNHDHTGDHSHGHSHGDNQSRKSVLLNILIGLITVVVTPFVIGFISDVSIQQLQDSYSQNTTQADTEIILGRVIETEQEEISTPPSSTFRNVVRFETENSEELVVENLYASQNQVPRLRSGDRIFIGKFINPTNNEIDYTYIDVYRLDKVFWLIAIFIIIVIVLTGLRGVNAFIGLIFTTMVIFNYLLPEILTGGSIIWTTFFVSIVIILISMYLSHGFSKPTSIAVLGTLATISLTFFISILVERAMNFTGVSSHELTHIQNFQSVSDRNLNLRSLFLASIILGSLGVLDDVTVAQSYIVDELYKARRSFKPMEVFWSALRVGQQHIVSLINTLTLAYVATGLPIVIQFIIFGYGDIFVSINSEVISGEIVRTVIGSSALILAIPITTIIAVYALNPNDLNGSKT